MSEHIPFFSDVPTMAIPAVQRLFDEAQDPGYSLPLVYSNLVSRLNSVSVQAPARALVKRWLAGVKVGLVARPVMPGGADVSDAPIAPEPGYFERLPEAAMPALAIVWDAVQIATGSEKEEQEDERAFDDFFGAMREIGLPEPQWRLFIAYVRAIRAGQVERPARQVAIELPDVTSSALADEEETTSPRKRHVKADVFVEHPVTGEAVRPEIVAEIDNEARAIVGADVEYREPEPEVADTEGFVALTPTNYREFAQGGVMPDPVPALPSATVLEFLGEKEAEADVVGKLRSVRDDLVASTYAALQANMHRRATQIVAGQLRAMADEMEGGAV